MEQRQKTPLLEVNDISVTFRMYSGALEQEDLKVISSLSLDVTAHIVLVTFFRSIFSNNLPSVNMKKI